MKSVMHNSFTLRKAGATDIPDLAALHVVTWAATYPHVENPPTFAIREWQWQEQFKKNDKNWFCLVIENEQGEMIGFSRGIKEGNGGDLNKLYLLKHYHGLGLGKWLLHETVHQLISMDVDHIWVMAEPNNPTCAFYEKMGGIRKTDTKPGVAVYVWRDFSQFKKEQ